MTEPQRLRLLLVEDDAAVADMYRLKLERDDYLVEVAHDGESALMMAAARPFDLIFLDIQLPKLDGLRVLERLRCQDATRHTPVVILSNLDETELQDQGKRLGASDFVIKSKTTPAEVSRRVGSWSRLAAHAAGRSPRERS